MAGKSASRLPKYDFKFNVFKWGLHTQLLRFRWKKPLEKSRIDVLWHLSFGLGNLANAFAKGFWFYIGGLSFNQKEGDWKAFGFGVPIKSTLNER